MAKNRRTPKNFKKSKKSSKKTNKMIKNNQEILRMCIKTQS